MESNGAADPITVHFLEGEPLTIVVKESDYVRVLADAVKASRPPPKSSARLKLLTAEGEISALSQLLGPFLGATVTAVYEHSDTSYLVVKDGRISLIDEGDEGWSEELSRKAFVKEESWVPAPPAPNADGGFPEILNLAKESEGVVVSATSNIFKDAEKLNNVIRLGSKFGEPRYMPGGDNSFIFGSDDRDPTLYLEFGKHVCLIRVGSMIYADRWVNFMEVSSSTDNDSSTADWQLWGRDTAHHNRGGTIFFDREPTTVRLLRFRATSGHVRGARIGPLFAYGFAESIPASSKEIKP